jgi:hypothetical protein
MKQLYRAASQKTLVEKLAKPASTPGAYLYNNHNRFAIALSRGSSSKKSFQGFQPREWGDVLPGIRHNW